MQTKRIGFVIYPGMQALDLAGPMDAFAAAVIDADGSAVRCYETVTIGLDAKVVAAESGLCFKPHYTLRSAPRLDTLVIPGGAGMRDPRLAASVGAWVAGQARRLRRIAAVCTGVYGLAATGLLDGRRVTTHWRYAQDLARRFPALRVDADGPLFVKDGAFYTSAGICAGIDLSLALIEEDWGPGVALSVARELVVYLKRPGGQAQYSEPLRFQAQSADRIADIAAFIVANLQKDLSVEALAARARLCPRQFTRRFKHAFGATPAAFVEVARIDEARRRLAASHGTVERVANSVGFRSDAVLRRAFERRLGISPSAYRTRFGARASA
jgi:transcriptional regulator GlxA family with amidase domain